MKLIIGDNPFFGVNHKSGSKTLEDEGTRFHSASLIISEAAKCSFSTFMLSAHPGYQKLLAMADEELGTTKGCIDLALVIPYPHSLNKMVAEGGYTALAGAFGYKALFLSLFELIGSVLSENTRGLVTPFKRLIKIELDSIHTRSIRPKYICLHNVVTDILLAAERHDILNSFAAACTAMGLTPVFISQNPISLLKSKVSYPHVCCFTYNALGYMVNPSLKDVDDYLTYFNEPNVELWAMQVFASGALSTDQALTKHLLSNFQGIVYATTKQSRVVEFSDKIKNSS